MIRNKGNNLSDMGLEMASLTKIGIFVTHAMYAYGTTEYLLPRIPDLGSIPDQEATLRANSGNIIY